MNKPNIVWKPANYNNYTDDRGGVPIRKLTFHHIVGSMESAYGRFSNPNGQASSTYICGDGRIWQCCTEEQTPWTNGNYASNQESITIEFEGDWRFGYWNEGCINTGAQLVAWIRSRYPNITPNRHREVSLTGTVCPADFPVEEVWNRATKLLQTPAPVIPPTPVVNLKVADIVNRKVVLNKNCNLWDLGFTAWANAKAVKAYTKGTEIEISATATHPLGGLYYLTEYSYSKGIMNGFNSKDCDEIAPPPVEPPVVPPVVVPPVVEPPVTPPADTDLDKENNTILKQILKIVTDIWNKITSVFK